VSRLKGDRVFGVVHREAAYCVYSIAIQHKLRGWFLGCTMVCFDIRFVSRCKQVECVVHGVVRSREHFLFS
jgi:hypothetical protein